MNNEESVDDLNKGLDLYTMEMALVLVTREFFIDNNEAVKDFFITGEVIRQKAEYETKKRFFDKDKQTKKAERVVTEYFKTRSKLINGMDILDFSGLEDRMDDKADLDFFMTTIRNLIDQILGNTKKGDKITIR